VLNQQSRKILLLSGRKKTHLVYLKSHVDDFINKNKLNTKTFYYTGDCTDDELHDAEKNGDLLFATYDMAQEALDIERLNTIILATSKPDVIQAVGRILRKELRNGDLRPLIIDLADDLSIFEGQSLQRVKFYKQCKYVISTYYANDNKFNDNVTYDEILKIPPVEIVEYKEEENEEEKPKIIKKELDVSVFDE
jgi:predicted helicase